MKRNKINYIWIFVVIWMIVIFLFSSQSAVNSDELSRGLSHMIMEIFHKIMPGSQFHMDNFNHFLRKNAHFFVYMALGILVYSAVKKDCMINRKCIIISVLVCISYAISDELHQLFVPGRGAGIGDVFIDSMGSFMGIVLQWGILKFKRGC